MPPFKAFEQLLAAFALDEPLACLGHVLGIAHPFQPLSEALRRVVTEFPGRHPPHQLHLPGAAFRSAFGPPCRFPSSNADRQVVFPILPGWKGWRRRGHRLSVMPVSGAEWEYILSLEQIRAPRIPHHPKSNSRGSYTNLSTLKIAMRDASSC